MTTDRIRLTEDEIDSLVEAGMAAMPNRALVAAIVDDLIPAIEGIVNAQDSKQRCDWDCSVCHSHDEEEDEWDAEEEARQHREGSA